jgi:WXG100 family type VII secretion target
MSANITQAQYQQLENVATQFAQESERMRQVQQVVVTVCDNLARGGWLADAATQFQREMANDVHPAISRLVGALAEAASVTRQISMLLQQAEDEAAAHLNGQGGPHGMIPMVHPGADPLNPFGIAASGGFMTSWYNEGPRAANGINYKDFPYHNLNGQYDRFYAGLRYGNMSAEQIDKFLRNNPFEVKPDQYLNRNVNFYRQNYSGGMAVGQAQFGGDNWNVNARALSLEGAAGYSFGYGKDGLQAKANFDAGAYLARVTGSAEYGGLRASGDAYIGANINGEASATFNPMSGDVRGRIGGEAFVGGRAGGEVSYGMGPARVGAQGSVSYGLGVTGRADVGFQDGVFRAEVLAGATVGLGLEGGFTVELDLQSVTTQAVDLGRQGVDWVGSWFD